MLVVAAKRTRLGAELALLPDIHQLAIQMKPSPRCIAIGASSGGVDAILRLASQLPPDFPAPILFVQHIGAHRSRLAELIRAKGRARAVEASGGDVPQAGTIYIAPPDRHLLLDQGVLRLSASAKENHARPAIDPLFRSVALEYGANAIGVVLTGLLDDGSAGLKAIKQLGGIAVVQDPADAYAPGMPENAIANVQVDHVVELDKLGRLLHELVLQPAAMKVGNGYELARSRVEREHSVELGSDNAMNKLASIGHPSTFTCPDCGGVLFELEDKQPVRYRCHTGHALSLRSLAHAQEGVTDVALWASLRSLQEKELILRRLADMQSSETNDSATEALREANELAAAAATLRRLVERAPRSRSYDEL
jgi:two-component system chemotaxis response regulator CheB